MSSGGAGHCQLLQVIHEHLQTDVISQDRSSRLLNRITRDIIKLWHHHHVTLSSTHLEAESHTHLTPGVHVVVSLGGVHFGQQEAGLNDDITSA